MKLAAVKTLEVLTTFRYTSWRVQDNHVGRKSPILINRPQRKNTVFFPQEYDIHPIHLINSQW
jgi:hypothetical protein